MKNFIQDAMQKVGDQTVTLGDTVYNLKVGTTNCTLHILEKGQEPDSVDLTFQDLKALYYLLTTQCK